MTGYGATGGRHRESSRSTESEDGRLMDLVRDGDVEAFDELYRRYRPKLQRFVRNLVRRPQLVEEIVNDTMLVVWRRPDSFNSESKLSTWIFGIGYRKSLKALHRLDEPVEDRDRHHETSVEDDPEAQVGQRKLHEALMRALDQLSADHRAVVDLTYFHHLGYREIAEIMGCPNDTVKTRMFHARRNLKRILAGELADWL